MSWRCPLPMPAKEHSVGWVYWICLGSGLPEILDTVARYGAGCVLMTIDSTTRCTLNLPDTERVQRRQATERIHCYTALRDQHDESVLLHDQRSVTHMTQ